MSDPAPYEFQAGPGPLLVSIPHDGHLLPAEIAERMTPAGQAGDDADWHVRRLYECAAELGASQLAANYSRYVIDLNRPAGGEALYPGQDETGLCPTSSFRHEALYRPGQEPTAREIAQRVSRYWAPYHQRLAAELNRIREQHGFALLWEAHSIRSRVPRFFTGRLPDFNFGTDGGRTAPVELTSALARRASEAGYSTVVDGRFRGGYSTRRYADPDKRVFTLQLELSQATYLAEPAIDYDADRAAPVRALVRELLEIARDGLPG